MRQKRRKTATSKALIIHPDRDEVTKNQMDKYQAALRSQAELTEVLRKFAEVDRPFFETWLESTFETIYTEIAAKLDELTGIREEMEAIDSDSNSMEKLPEDDVLSIEKLDLKIDSNSSTEYFKKVYHACVRLIHPDVVPSKNFDGEVWQELQTAYASKDYQKLEMLRERILDSETPRVSQTPGELCDLRLHVQKQIKDLKRQIAEAKREPSWQFKEKFENPKGLKRLFKKLETELIEDLQALTIQVRYARLELDRL